MNNLPFSSGHPVFAIKEELAPSRREEKEEFKELSDTFQQGLRLCSPRLQASMDDYSINYRCSMVTRSSAHFEMSSGVDRKPKRSSSLDYARGLSTPKRSLSLPPTLRRLFGFEGGVVPILASPIIDFNRGTPHKALSNLSTPRTDFSTDDTDGSWTAGLQLVSYEDGSTMTKMSGTQIEHFNSGDEMSPNNVSHSSVPTISDDFDQPGVPIGPLANRKMNERASLLDNFNIVVSPHLDNSVTSMEEQRRAAKLTRALEEPFEYGLQNRVMTEYELQLTLMDNDNEFDFISLSPTFLLSPTEDNNWEGNLVFQFENQVQFGDTTEASPTQPQVPDLVSQEDSSAITKMPGTPFKITEQFRMEAEMFANSASDSNLLVNVVNFNQPASFSQQHNNKAASLANGIVGEQNSPLLGDSPTKRLPHKNSLRLNHSEYSIQERRQAAKAAKPLEEPYKYNLQNRIVAEYEEQLTPMDNVNGFDFISLSPVFPLTPMENSNWEKSLIFQFENQVQLGVKSDSNPTELEFPELVFQEDGSAMTKKPGDHFRIPEQVNMEAETLDNTASNLNLLINLINPNLPGFKDASLANGTEDEQNAALVNDSSAATESHFNNSMDSIEEKLCTANLVKPLEEPYEYNLQNRIMLEYELQLSPMDFSYEHASNFSTPTFFLHPKEDGNRKEQLNFQFPIQPQLENNRDSKPIDAKADEQASIHARRLAARMDRKDEREYELNEQNRVMKEYEQMEPIDVTDDIDYLCPSPIYQGSQTAELDFSSDSEVPESMNSFSSLTSSSSLTEDSPNGNGDNSSPVYRPTTESRPTYEFDALALLEEQLRFISLAKNNETGQDFFNQQRFAMEEFERNEPMDVRNGMSYQCLSPLFATSSSFFTAQDSTDTKPTNNNQCDSCCESVKEPEHSTHPLLPSIGYSAQSLDQCGRNRNEPLDDGREESPSQHFDNGFSDGWSQCAKDSGSYKNSSGIKQSYHEEAADPTGREVFPTGHLCDFPGSTISSLLDSKNFPVSVQTCKCFDEDDDDDEIFTKFNDQPLDHTQMEGGEDERFPHSQSSGSANDTDSSSAVDVFVSAPSAIERRVMSEFPGCSMEHARSILDCRLHSKIARQLDLVDTCNQEETVMMEFEASLGSGVCDDEDDGFSGEVAIDVDNHEEDWNNETREVCEAGTSQQLSLVNPPDSGGC